MSKILDAVTNDITSKPKQATPAKAQSAKGQALEAVTARVLSPELELLVQRDYKASKMVVKVEGAEYSAFKELVLACQAAGVFQDVKLLKLVQTRICVVFNSETIATRRNTMLNNTAKVAFGGIVGRESDGSKRTVAGKGWNAVLEVLNKATSIRTYHPLITAAKPEAMKASPKSDIEKAASLEKAKRNAEAAAVKEAAKLSKIVTHAQAFTIALETLAMVEKFLLPGTHPKQLQQLHDLAKFFAADLEAEKLEAEKVEKAA